VRDFERSLKLKAAIIGSCVLLAWVVELVDEVAYGGSLDRFGIHPRNIASLWGILLAPLLHAGWVHLASNTGPFIALGWLVLLRGVASFVLVTLCAIVIGGFGVWVFGAPNSIHNGASGLFFGYLGYLLARGYFERSLGSVLLALTAGALYGGLLWGILPGQRGISWEGHVFGLLSGFVAAYLLVELAATRAIRRSIGPR